MISIGCSARPRMTLAAKIAPTVVRRSIARYAPSPRISDCMARRKNLIRLAKAAARSVATALAARLRVAVAAPAAGQPGDHAEGGHDLGVAEARLGEGEALGARVVAFAQRPAGQRLVRQGQADQERGGPQRERAEQGVEHEDDGDVERRPGKIEHRLQAAARHELAQRVEIAERLAAQPAVAACRDRCRDQAVGEDGVQPQAGAAEQARAHQVEGGERPNRDQAGPATA